MLSPFAFDPESDVIINPALETNAVEFNSLLELLRNARADGKTFEEKQLYAIVHRLASLSRSMRLRLAGVDHRAVVKWALSVLNGITEYESLFENHEPSKQLIESIRHRRVI